jgi:UDPglucose 6-dehydrogenase
MNNQLTMFDLPKIGVVGAGYVGGTIAQAYSHHANVVCVDADPSKSTGTWQDLMDCEAVFVCVPSPSKSNGECDTSILNSVLYMLKDYDNLIISKVTAPPEAYERLQEVYINLVHVPEFLTASNALSDFLSEEYAIIGGRVLAFQKEAERILKIAQPLKSCAYTSIGEAALSKYIINSFLATKVVFMNEMYDLADSLGYDWRKVSLLVSHDERIGNSHLKAPGPDGSFGFGGACFPKDTEAMVKFASKKNVNLNILRTALKKNDLLRLRKPK